MSGVRIGQGDATETRKIVGQWNRFATWGMWRMWFLGFGCCATFLIARDVGNPLPFAIVCIALLWTSNLVINMKEVMAEKKLTITEVIEKDA